mgnify:CR=1 FL=1
MALSDPLSATCEAEIGAAQTISFGDLVLLVPEYLPVVDGADSQATYEFKYTAVHYTSGTAAHVTASQPGVYGVVSGKRSTMATDGTGKLSAGVAGDKINVIIAGLAFANCLVETVAMTTAMFLYVGDITADADAGGKLVTDTGDSNTAANISNTIDNATSDAAHTEDYLTEVRAKALNTTNVALGANVFSVQPVWVFNNPIGAVG